MIAAPTIPRVADLTTNRAFDAVETAIDLVIAAPLVQALVLAPVTIGTTDTRVCHGLGRSLRGYFLVKAPADVRVFDGATAEAIDPRNYVTLRASSSQKVTLAVF